jgi:hypothetical protein
MSSFPPADWKSRYIQDYESFAAATPAPTKLHVILTEIMKKINV